MIALPNAYFPRKANWRSFGQYLGAQVQPGDAVVFGAKTNPAYLPGFYLLCSSPYAGPPKGPMVLLDRPADAALMRQLSTYPRVWLVSDQHDPSPLLPGATIEGMRAFPSMGSSIMRVGVPKAGVTSQ